MSFRIPLLLCLFVSLIIPDVSAVCYLEDANADCEVCWRTSYSSAEDKIGVTALAECPDGVVAKWELPLPELMVEMVPYPVNFSIAIDRNVIPATPKGSDSIVPHANIHSCIASRGACTPFVANSPGLATHTPALKGDLDHTGYVMFSTTVQLVEEQYTIIAHIRFFIPNADPTLPMTKYDAAIGISRVIQPQTALCAPGSVYDVATEECKLCPRGTHQLGSTCAPCQPGTFGPQIGLAQCVPCTKGFTNETGALKCEQCPSNTQRPAGTPGLTVLECECVFGSYAKEGAGHACELCPTGAWCEGGLERPVPLSGYWADKECTKEGGCEGWDVFMECHPPSDCLGTADFLCQQGHTGRMCRSVEDGYFVVGGQFWAKCGPQGVLINVLGILAVIVVWVGINAIASGDYDALDTALLYVQITGMVASYGMKWHSRVDAVNTVLGVANFDVDFVTPMCIGEWTPVHAFYTQLILPFIFAACVATYLPISHVIAKVRGKASEVDFKTLLAEAKSKLINQTLSFIIIVYHTLCLKCFMVFRCDVFPDGKSYLHFAPDTECWTQSHKGMVAVACLYIPVVLFGVPLFMLHVVRKAMREGTLHDQHIQSRYGFFYGRYDTEYKWWECMIMVRRIAIAFVSVAIDTSMLQAAITIVVLLLLLNLHTATRPFVSDMIDTLEVFTLCGSIFYALAGLLFYPSITQKAQGEICVGGEEEAVSVCQEELRFKDVISVLLLVWTACTLAVSFFVAFFRIREIRASGAATRIIKEKLQIAGPY